MSDREDSIGQKAEFTFLESLERLCSPSGLPWGTSEIAALFCRDWQSNR